MLILVRHEQGVNKRIFVPHCNPYPGRSSHDPPTITMDRCRLPPLNRRHLFIIVPPASRIGAERCGDFLDDELRVHQAGRESTVVHGGAGDARS